MTYSIAIFHPSHHLGGTEILFSRLIDELVRTGFSVSVIDYGDGVLKNNLRKKGVAYYDYEICREGENWRDLVRANIFVVSARNIIRYLFLCINHKQYNTRVMFWQLHPSELYSGQFPFTARVKKILGYNGLRFFLQLMPGIRGVCQLINELSISNNLRIMDEACYMESTWILNCKLKKNYLPLLTGMKEIKIQKGHYYKRPCKVKNIAIISRLEEFKTYGVIKAIEDILDINDKIYIHVVGDGKDRLLIENIFKSKNRVFFYGFINNLELNQFFCEHAIDILFAMGTSALEGASRGIPTVRLPCLDKPLIKKNVYKFIHDQNGYSLGEYLDTPFCSEGYYSMNVVFEKINQDNICESTIQFFNNYYADEKIKQLVIE
ncbi:glycosyltransferase family 4 protein, partial [Salmonella enterica]|nr:glycosyltransferase family 4 protein [Salmonella enterica]